MHLLYMFQDTYWVHSLGLQLLHSYQDKQQSRNFQVSQIKMKRKLRPHATIKYFLFLNFLLQRSKFAWWYIWVLLLSTERQGFLSTSSLVGKLWVTPLKKSRVELFLLFFTCLSPCLSHSAAMCFSSLLLLVTVSFYFILTLSSVSQPTTQPPHSSSQFLACTLWCSHSSI